MGNYSSIWRSYKLFCATNIRYPGYKKHLQPLAKKYFLWLIVFEIIAVTLICLGKLLFDVIESMSPLAKAWWVVALFLLTIVLRIYCFKIMDTLRNNFNHGVMCLLKAEGHYTELELSKDFHDLHGTGEKEAIIAKNIDKVIEFVDQVIFVAIPAVVKICLLFCCLGLFAPRFAVLLFGTMLVFWWRVVRDGPVMQEMSEEYNEEKKDINEYGSDLTQSVRVLQVHGAGRRFGRYMERRVRRFWKRDNPRHTRWRGRLAIQDAVSGLSQVVLVAIMIQSAYEGVYGTPKLVLVLSVMGVAYSNFGFLSSFQRYLIYARDPAEELLQIFLTKPSVRNCPNPLVPQSLLGQITIQNVWFRYSDFQTQEENLGAGEPQSSWVLKGVDLVIPAGKRVAFVGATGSGKSTLAALLAREYDPVLGLITLDGIPLTELDLNWFRGRISVVHQDIRLLHDTLRNNLRAFNPQASDDAINNVLEISRMNDFLPNLQDGLETMIGENGHRLSGGQRQRTGIARALLRNPKILILDESTSALDAKTQHELQMSLEQYLQKLGSTTITIAHRLSTIINSDIVVWLDEGRVRAQGLFQELVDKEPEFREYIGLEFQSLNLSARSV